MEQNEKLESFKLRLETDFDLLEQKREFQIPKDLGFDQKPLPALSSRKGNKRLFQAVGRCIENVCVGRANRN